MTEKPPPDRRLFFFFFFFNSKNLLRNRKGLKNASSIQTETPPWGRRDRENGRKNPKGAQRSRFFFFFHVLQFTLIAKTCQTAQDHENVTENRLDPNIKMNGVNEVRTYKGKGARVKNERMKNEE